MPRTLVLGNGNILATFDDFLQLRDFYYPYVGMEDHTTFGKFHRVGLFVDGQMSWLSDGSWQIDLKYHDETLVGKCTARNAALGLEVLFEDFVYTTHDILFRKLTITNHSDPPNHPIACFFPGAIPSPDGCSRYIGTPVPQRLVYSIKKDNGHTIEFSYPDFS